MTSQPDLQSPQPPRIAGWLVVLFTPPGLAESIMGDLLEEFSALVVKSGVGFARLWYWRQALKTILHASGNAFRIASWLMLAAVIGGFWLIGFATRFSLHAMQTFLDAHQVYELDPSAYLFWLKFPLEIGRVILCALIGALVAFTAKRMEMAAVVALALLQMALFEAATVALIIRGREWFEWFLVMLLWNGLCAIATVAGGAIVRTRRSGATTRHSAA
jgi:hypothetical protein